MSTQAHQVANEHLYFYAIQNGSKVGLCAGPKKPRFVKKE